MPSKANADNSSSEYTLRLPYPRLAESSFYARDHEIRVLTDEALFDACGTRIAFTLRHGGVSKAPYHELNLAYTVDDDASLVDENRLLLLEALGAKTDGDSLISPLQVHGCDVLLVRDVVETAEKAAQGADGIVCTQPDIPALLCFADCVPVILVSPDGSFAVLHAGWRGAFGGIPGIGLRELRNATSCIPSEVNCYIGPHIGPCCYEFDEELLVQFVERYGAGCDVGDRHLDLSHAVSASLLAEGASADRIVDAHACTSCNTVSFYSHRAENGHTGRHGAYAMRKEMP